MLIADVLEVDCLYFGYKKNKRCVLYVLINVHYRRRLFHSFTVEYCTGMGMTGNQRWPRVYGYYVHGFTAGMVFDSPYHRGYGFDS